MNSQFHRSDGSTRLAYKRKRGGNVRRMQATLRCTDPSRLITKDEEPILVSRVLQKAFCIRCEAAAKNGGFGAKCSVFAFARRSCLLSRAARTPLCHLRKDIDRFTYLGGSYQDVIKHNPSFDVQSLPSTWTLSEDCLPRGSTASEKHQEFTEALPIMIVLFMKCGDSSQPHSFLICCLMLLFLFCEKNVVSYFKQHHFL